MRSSQLLAYLLIGVGTVALLSRVGPGTGWLWVALAATGFLAAYRKEGTYALLVVGCILAGIAAGFLLEGAWGWHGAFLMSLGAGFLAIDRIEPRESRWPIYPAAGFVGVGLVYWLFRTGVLQSLWFPFLMIVFGVYLLRRNEGSGWVEVGGDPKTPGETPGETPVDAPVTAPATEEAAAPGTSASRPDDEPRRGAADDDPAGNGYRVGEWEAADQPDNDAADDEPS